MEQYSNFKIEALKNNLAGRYFNKWRNSFFVMLEILGRSLSMTMRVLLRKDIGVESYNITNVIVGFLWIRLCVSLSAAIPEDIRAFDNVFNPLAFNDVATGMLNVFGYIYLLATIWIFIRTELAPIGEVDVNSNGATNLFQMVIQKEKSVFLREGFVQAGIVPSICFLIGLVCWQFNQSFGIGLFLTISSVALSIDEIVFHRAAIRLRRIYLSNEKKARKEMAKYRKLKEIREE
jgi:hypothetical protein